MHPAILGLLFNTFKAGPLQSNCYMCKLLLAFHSSNEQSAHQTKLQYFYLANHSNISCCQSQIVAHIIPHILLY